MKSRHGFTYQSDYRPPSLRSAAPAGQVSGDMAYWRWLEARYGEAEAKARVHRMQNTPKGIIAMRTFATEAQAIAAVEAIMRLGMPTTPLLLTRRVDDPPPRPVLTLTAPTSSGPLIEIIPPEPKRRAAR